MSIKSVWPCTYTAARKTPRKEHRCIAPLGSRELQGDGPRSAHPLFWGLIAGVTSKGPCAPWQKGPLSSLGFALLSPLLLEPTAGMLAVRARRRAFFPFFTRRQPNPKVRSARSARSARSFLRTVADALKPVALNLARPEGCDATMLLSRRLSSRCIRTRPNLLEWLDLQWRRSPRNQFDRLRHLRLLPNVHHIVLLGMLLASPPSTPSPQQLTRFVLLAGSV